MILPESFYQRDTVTMARELLGTFLVHKTRAGRTVGRIVETEAYLFENDPACHAHKGMTRRNAAMFGPPGRAYIYLIYGMYHCFNVVTAREGVGEAVLIRALEPIDGVELMQKRRGTEELKNLCSGPGKLVIAMGMGPKLNGCPLFSGPLTLHSRESFKACDPHCTDEIVATRRIGITLAAHLPLRFFLKGTRFVSKVAKS
jgi:DNA-3-methyladenine glycosylase